MCSQRKFLKCNKNICEGLLENNAENQSLSLNKQKKKGGGLFNYDSGDNIGFGLKRT